jgi:hypothetical protein
MFLPLLTIAVFDNLSKRSALELTRAERRISGARELACESMIGSGQSRQRSMPAFFNLTGDARHGW